LACSGLTAYNALKKTCFQVGDTLVIVGAGGPRLMALQLAKAITKSRLRTSMIINCMRLKKPGADEVVNSSSVDPGKD
jgi:propanol-preferring alcohol dehydrogenase